MLSLTSPKRAGIASQWLSDRSFLRSGPRSTCRALTTQTSTPASCRARTTLFGYTPVLSITAPSGHRPATQGAN